jgi:hypothetical protein
MSSELPNWDQLSQEFGFNEPVLKRIAAVASPDSPESYIRRELLRDGYAWSAGDMAEWIVRLLPIPPASPAQVVWRTITHGSSDADYQTTERPGVRRNRTYTVRLYRQACLVEVLNWVVYVYTLPAKQPGDQALKPAAAQLGISHASLRRLLVTQQLGPISTVRAPVGRPVVEVISTRTFNRVEAYLESRTEPPPGWMVEDVIRRYTGWTLSRFKAVISQNQISPQLFQSRLSAAQVLWYYDTTAIPGFAAAVRSQGHSLPAHLPARRRRRAPSPSQTKSAPQRRDRKARQLAPFSDAPEFCYTQLDIAEATGRPRHIISQWLAREAKRGVDYPSRRILIPGHSAETIFYTQECLDAAIAKYGRAGGGAS